MSTAWTPTFSQPTATGMLAPLAAPVTPPPVLLVADLGDSAPGHWLARWSDEHPSWRRVAQRDWNAPELDRWAAAIARAIDDCARPPVIVAHGFGALAAVRAAYLLERSVAGALLVAPSDPDACAVASKLPARRLPYPSVLVASSNDPSLKLLKGGALAMRWGSRFVPKHDAGHFDAASGHGRWTEGLLLLGELRNPPRAGLAMPGRR